MSARILVVPPPPPAPARILVTGAQGFIGRYVVAHCLAADPEASVVGIGRSRPLADAFTHRVEWAGEHVAAPLPDALRQAAASGRYRYERLDVRDTAGVLDLIRGFAPTAVIHLSGALRDEATDRLLHLNVLGTESLYEAIAGAGIAPPTVVLGSSGSIYGARPDDRLPVAPESGDAPPDLYAVSKLAAEHAARVLAARHGVPTVRARIFCVAGPGQEERHLCGWLGRQVAEIRAGIRPPVVHAGPLDTSRDFVDVRDVARALHLLAWRGTSGRCYNVASGVETRGEEVYGQLLDLAGLAGSVRRSTAPARPADVPRLFADVGALRELGWAPEVPLRATLDDLLAYYRERVAPLRTEPEEADERDDAGVMHVSSERPHTYAVQVREGLMGELPELLARRYPGTRMVVLTDTRVDGLCAAPLVEAMRARGIPVEPVVVPEGEGSKSAAVLLDVVQRLYAAGFDRRGLLLNVGGGLVTDLGGFAAAVYMRGVRYLNVPTTLLAQNDAAVGGKVAVNTPWAKNFLGAFHDPEAVFCDPGVLRTLPRRALAAGVAESIKVALCGDPVLFGLLERESHAILVDRDPAVLGEVVRRSIEVKIRLLDPDPFERDLRRALNLGHTFAHPLETQLGYARILHGEAVGYGMALATAVARRRGVCDDATAARVTDVLAAYGLPPRVPREEVRAALQHVHAVRLVRANQLHFVLPERIGAVRIVPEVPQAELEAALEEAMQTVPEPVPA
jgi:3-dehydroquinate synthase